MLSKKVSFGQLSLLKAKECLLLAKKYLKMAKKFSGELDCRRGVIDIGYNAAELCAKGYLFLKLKRIPKTHTGIVQKFGEYYVKNGLVDKEIGRNLRRCLEYRNKARYKTKALITKEMVQSTIELARDLIRLLNKRVSKPKS